MIFRFFWLFQTYSHGTSRKSSLSILEKKETMLLKQLNLIKMGLYKMGLILGSGWQLLSILSNLRMLNFCLQHDSNNDNKHMTTCMAM